jgi:nitrogen fixation protein
MALTDTIPRRLNSSNIEKAIKNYLHLLADLPLNIISSDPFDFLKKIKRKPVGTGPYPCVTLFEAANRIMTDLVILVGVRELLRGKIPDLDFDEYIVELGNEDSHENDISATRNGWHLRGEAFNVAESFFQGKKTLMLKKLRKKSTSTDRLLLLFNSEAVSTTYVAKNRINEYYLPVDIECLKEEMTRITGTLS